MPRRLVAFVIAFLLPCHVLAASEQAVPAEPAALLQLADLAAPDPERLDRPPCGSAALH